MNFAKSRLQNRTKYPLTYKKTATEVTVFLYSDALLAKAHYRHLISGVVHLVRYTLRRS